MVPKIAMGGSAFAVAKGYYLSEGLKPKSEAEAMKRAHSLAENTGFGMGDYVLSEGYRQADDDLDTKVKDHVHWRDFGHDPVNTKTGERASRVGFVATRNVGVDDPRRAFELMQMRYEAYMEECKSKRGRKLALPVYAFSLSWAIGEKPGRTEKLSAAEGALKAIHMDANQAVIVEHLDKEYHHIHVIVNRVHPTESRSVHTSADFYNLSQWAQAYEQERGQIFCEQRVANNAARSKGAAAKDNASNTRAEIEAARAGEVFDELQAAQMVREKLARIVMPRENGSLIATHKVEREALERLTRKTIDAGKQKVREKYRPQWRAVYQKQTAETSSARAKLTGIFGRACFVFLNLKRLGEGRVLSRDEKFALIKSKALLLERLAHVHQMERLGISLPHKDEVKALANEAWKSHRESWADMRERHASEIKAASAETARIEAERAAAKERHEQAVAEAARAVVFVPALSDYPGVSRISFELVKNTADELQKLRTLRESLLSVVIPMQRSLVTLNREIDDPETGRLRSFILRRNKRGLLSDLVEPEKQLGDVDLKIVAAEKYQLEAFDALCLPLFEYSKKARTDWLAQIKRWSDRHHSIPIVFTPDQIVTELVNWIVENGGSLEGKALRRDIGLSALLSEEKVSYVAISDRCRAHLRELSEYSKAAILASCDIEDFNRGFENDFADIPKSMEIVRCLNRRLNALHDIHQTMTNRGYVIHNEVPKPRDWFFTPLKIKERYTSKLRQLSSEFSIKRQQMDMLFGDGRWPEALEAGKANIEWIEQENFHAYPEFADELDSINTRIAEMKVYVAATVKSYEDFCGFLLSSDEHKSNGNLGNALKSAEFAIQIWHAHASDWPKVLDRLNVNLGGLVFHNERMSGYRSEIDALKSDINKQNNSRQYVPSWGGPGGF